MITLDRAALERFAPPAASKAKATIRESYLAALLMSEFSVAAEAAGMTTWPRLRAFLATVAVETNFALVWESGAYTAEGIVRTFGAGRHSAAVTPSEARRIAGNAYALFERVYGLGNPRKAAELGNAEPGDGYKYRGCGPQQITGKADHVRYAARLGIEVEALAEPLNGLRAALLEWTDKGCNRYADARDLLTLRCRINGGTAATVNGLPEFRHQMARAEQIFGGDTDASRPDASATPAPSAARDRGPGTLALGQDGDDVEALQRDLAAAGYHCGAADGVYGPLVERAVASFQVAHGLPATGKADQTTRNVIHAHDPGQVLPGRATLSLADVRARGSTTLTLLGRLRAGLRWVQASVLGVAGGEAAGLSPIEATLGAVETARGLTDRASAALGVAIEPKYLILGAAAVAMLAGLGWIARVEAARLDDAQSGANLGR